MAALTPRGSQRVVPDSGDMIQLAKPDVVVAAIHDMVDQVMDARRSYADIAT